MKGRIAGFFLGLGCGPVVTVVVLDTTRRAANSIPTSAESTATLVLMILAVGLMLLGAALIARSNRDDDARGEALPPNRFTIDGLPD